MTVQPRYRERLIRFLTDAAYIVCIVPGNLVLRLFRRDPMQGRPDPAITSYWQKREEHGMAKPMKYPF